MQVILLQDVKKVGQKGSVVTVADGYAQNFLIARGFGKVATKEALAVHQKKVSQAQDEKNMREGLAEKALRALNGGQVSLTAKANEKGVLFKGITAGDIAQAIHTQHKVAVSAEHIVLSAPIKHTGEFPVTLKEKSVSATLSVSVTAQE